MINERCVWHLERNVVDLRRSELGEADLVVGAERRVVVDHGILHEVHVEAEVEAFAGRLSDAVERLGRKLVDDRARLVDYDQHVLVLIGELYVEWVEYFTLFARS